MSLARISTELYPEARIRFGYTPLAGCRSHKQRSLVHPFSVLFPCCCSYLSHLHLLESTRSGGETSILAPSLLKTDRDEQGT